MRRTKIPHNVFLALIVFVIIMGGIYLVGAALKSKMHDFEGKCQMCHRGTPPPNAERKDIVLVDESDRLCNPCHIVDREMSHPLSVVPSMPVPGEMPLDELSRITCITCHDVHKEDKGHLSKEQLAGLLRGHVKGRAFCFICHSRDIAMSSRRHQTFISYAHKKGSLEEKKGGSLLDSFSRECLSCHDGTISKMPSVAVKAGVWRHGTNLSHPIGVRYPRDGDFISKEFLPERIRLFDEKVGCLSCHDPYTKERNLLVINNRRSQLCLSCHRK